MVALPAAARGPAAPVLGNWEGVGPHGLPLSFLLTRAHRRVVVEDLVVGFPTACPQRPAPTEGVPYMHATYVGPGAPPRVRINWRPDAILIMVQSRTGPVLALEGRLLASGRAVLSMRAPLNEPRGCGWPATRLRWRVEPRRRLAVATGRWSGTVAAPGGVTGDVTVQVGSDGRTVDAISFEIRCPGGGSTSFSGGPPAYEFISAAGSFAGPRAGGERLFAGSSWQGTFGADRVLRGTFHSPDDCGLGQASAMGTFVARR